MWNQSRLIVAGFFWAPIWSEWSEASFGGSYTFIEEATANMHFWRIKVSMPAPAMINSEKECMLLLTTLVMASTTKLERATSVDESAWGNLRLHQISGRNQHTNQETYLKEDTILGSTTKTCQWYLTSFQNPYVRLFLKNQASLEVASPWLSAVTVPRYVPLKVEVAFTFQIPHPLRKSKIVVQHLVSVLELDFRQYNTVTRCGDAVSESDDHILIRMCSLSE